MNLRRVARHNIRKGFWRAIRDDYVDFYNVVDWLSIIIGPGIIRARGNAGFPPVSIGTNSVSTSFEEEIQDDGATRTV